MPPPLSVRIERRGAARQALAGLSILVAEDDEINQMMLESNLVEDGAQPGAGGRRPRGGRARVRDGPLALTTSS
jgi:CheY-like chemotaxis protein